MPLRFDLLPSSAIPIAYFAFAHLGLASAMLALAVRPGIAAGFFYHPPMLGLVHLLTLAWLSGSILGSFYIVAPVALRMPFPARAADWGAFAAFAAGTMGMVGHFWMEDRDSVAFAALLVMAAIAWVAVRAFRRLRAAPVPWPVRLHVGLAFFNILAAGSFGIVIALDRSRGFLGIAPLASTYAHAHLAAVGWAMMMVVGLSYRLIPMMLPAQPPTGASLAWSAVFIEAGLTVVVGALLTSGAGGGAAGADLKAGPYGASTTGGALTAEWLTGGGWLTAGGVLIAAGVASFVGNIRRTLRARVRRPPALPRRDWSIWQTHAAFAWLLVALAAGLVVSTGMPGERRVGWIWTYGSAGLVGFLAQIVTGMQGRLVPMYAWYRVFAASGGEPPARAANAIPSPPFARTIFILWTAGVPLLVVGLAAGRRTLISISAAVLFGAVVVGAVYLGHMLRAAGVPVAEPVKAASERGGQPAPAAEPVNAASGRGGQPAPVAQPFRAASEAGGRACPSDAPHDSVSDRHGAHRT